MKKISSIRCACRAHPTDGDIWSGSNDGFGTYPAPGPPIKREDGPAQRKSYDPSVPALRSAERMKKSFGQKRIMDWFFLMRNLNPDNRLVPNCPAIMPRGNRAHIAGAQLYLVPVIHSNTQSARNDIQNMIFLTTFALLDRF